MKLLRSFDQYGASTINVVLLLLLSVVVVKLVVGGDLKIINAFDG